MFQGPGFSAVTTSSPFGQSAFGKPATTGFNQPVFGATPAPSLFGGATTQQSGGGLFGSTSAAPAFGQTQTTQPAFGTSSGLFGAQQTATAGTGMFGSTPGSAFGQAKPAFGGFGTPPQSTGLFGQQPQAAQPQQTSLFGQPAAQSASGLFGTSTGFGGATTTGGTTTKFVPVTGTDTMIKNGTSQNINTRHHCITCMKEYESKSLEELRLEDYAANRKGPQQGTSGSMGGLFGNTAAQPSLFGASTSTGYGTGTASVFGTGAPQTSLFGKPAGAATAFGAPATTTAGNFGFNTSTPSNPFGANAAQKPFGTTTPQTGLFGQTSQPATGFGTQPTTGFGAFGTQQSTLFGQNKPTFNLANTSTAFNFNQPATSTTANSSLFGNKPPTSSFGTFGTPTATTSATFGTPSFGATNQNTSIFGTNFNKPSTGFNFGSTPTTNTLGTGLNLGGGSSLFGNTGAKPGGLFGQANQGSSLFGGTTFGSAGGTTFSTGSSGLGGLGGTSLNLGGTQPGQSAGGLGGNLNLTLNNPINQHLLAYASMPFGDSPLFKNLLPPSGKSDDLIKPTSPAAQKALITGQNYKVSPKNNTKIKVKPIESNTKKSLFEGLEGDEEPGDRSLLNSLMRPSPKRLILRPRPLQDSISSGSPSFYLPQPNLISMLSPVIKTGARFSLRHPPSPQTSHMDNSLNDESCINGNLHDETPNSNKILASLDKRKSSSDLEEKRMADPHSKSVESFSTPTSSHRLEPALEHPSTTSSSIDSEVENTGPAEVDESSGQTAHPAGIVLRRVGYFTIPRLEQLTHLVDEEGRCIVDNFTVGRLNYGNIFYPESFDVAGLNLDEIVEFRHKEVIVYPDDKQKPEVGEGLNRRAQVTLDRVWPVDKTTRMPITDPERIEAMDFEGKLRKVSAKHNTKFVDYRPETGSWVFKVDHFSKYGLSDSDEEEGPTELKKPKGVPPPAVPPPARPQISLKQGSNKAFAPTSMIIGDEDEDMDDGITSPFDLDERYEGKTLSPTGKLAKHLGTSSHKVQLMKASFFDQEDLNIDGDYLDYEDIMCEPKYKLDGYGFDTKKLSQALSWYNTGSFVDLRPDHEKLLEAQEEDDISTGSVHEKEAVDYEDLGEYLPDSLQPKVYPLRYGGQVLPMGRTVGGRVGARCLMDVGLMKGRSFTVSWGHSSQLTLLTTPSRVQGSLGMNPGDLLEGRGLADRGVQLVQRVALRTAIHTQSDFTFQETIEDHLEACLRHSQVKAGVGSACPQVVPQGGLAELHDQTKVAHCLLNRTSNQYIVFNGYLWGLCQALWGFIPGDDPPDSHINQMQRKTAVSEWLKKIVAKKVLDETDQKLDADCVYSFMTGYQVAEAGEAAQKIGDFNLSLLIAQSSSGPGTKSLIRDQLKQWRDTEADQHIDSSRLKMVMLVGGVAVHQASHRPINTCAGLDWLRAFAIHLWYMTSYTGSLTDAIVMYEKAFCSKEADLRYAPPPSPQYTSEYSVETSTEKPVFDIMYHLLKLFSFKSHPLEETLNTATYTADSLDYRLSWLLMRVLGAIGYPHLSELAACIIHSSFASQIESEGLWHWAIFVLLHLTDPLKRTCAVKDMIGRHVTLGDDTEEEIFLMVKLQISSKWIYEAKATKAIFLQRYNDAAHFLTKAGNWNEAHTLIINHISSKAIVNEKYDYLASLLSELAKENRSEYISNWANQGGVILEYLRVCGDVKEMVSRQDLGIGFQLERLQPQLTNLCRKIKLLKSDTPMDRLSQGEMAKRISGLIQNLVVAHCQDESSDTVNMLCQLLNELPLPYDHSQLEWLRVMATWRNTLTIPTNTTIT